MAEWKKVIVQGGNISQLNNDSNYVSVNALPAFTTASFGGVDTFASGSATSQNFSIVSGSVATDPTVGSGLLISASANERKATFTLRQIPTASLAHTGSYIGKTKVGLGEVVGTSTATAISGAFFNDIVATGSFTGSFKGDGSSLTGVAATLMAAGVYTASVQATGEVFTVKSGSTNIFAIDEKANLELGVPLLANTTNASASVVMGSGNNAIQLGGDYSLVNGENNVIAQSNSLVWGRENIVDAHATSGSVAIGIGLSLSGSGAAPSPEDVRQVVIGQYNSPTTASGDLFTIGNGIGVANRSNLAIFNTASIKFNAPVTGSSFTGSFVGDGSGLTGVASTLVLSGSNPAYGFLTGSVNLKTQYLQITGSGKEVEVTLITGSNGATFQVGLPSDVAISQSLTIGRNLTVDGDLYVQGTASFISTQDLYVADRFIVLASGSTTKNDSGIIIDRGAYVSGSVGYGYDANLNRWGYAANMTDTSNALVIDTNDGNSAFASYLFTETDHGPADNLKTGEFAQLGAFYVSGSDLYVLV